MTFFEQLLELDKSAFFFINNKLSNPFFDFLMPLLRDAKNWIPFYIFLLIFLPLKHKTKGWFWVLFALLTGACTDLISSHIIKQNIWRVRPCGDLSIAEHVRFIIAYCPQSSSFTSSHAANHFGIASFIFFTLHKFYGGKIWFIFLWAFLICFAQVYVGVHYPGDIIGGTIVGLLIGFLLSKIYNRYWEISKSESNISETKS